MHFVKIHPKIFHLALHLLILHTDLHHVRMFVARILTHGLEHLAIQDCRAAGAAVFGEQARAVDVDPVRAAKLEEQGQPAKGEKASACFLEGGGNIGVGKAETDDFSTFSKMGGWGDS